MKNLYLADTPNFINGCIFVCAENIGDVETKIMEKHPKIQINGIKLIDSMVCQNSKNLRLYRFDKTNVSANFLPVVADSFSGAEKLVKEKYDKPERIKLHPHNHHFIY